jgi:hypothetical protein
MNIAVSLPRISAFEPISQRNQQVLVSLFSRIAVGHLKQ